MAHLVAGAELIGFEGCSAHASTPLLQDIRVARKWLSSAHGITHVGIYGLSYGGLNTLQALARDSDLFDVRHWLQCWAVLL